MRKLRFGIVGYGSIASHHIKSIEALEHCELVALTSSNEQKREAAKAKFGIKVFEHIEDMVALPELDVVSICTPNGFHMDPCLAAAKAGKHVITEKPLEISVERCKQMIEACESAGVTLACIFQNRYIPGYRELIQIVKGGHLGKFILGNAYVKWFRPTQYYSSNNWRGTLNGDGGAALITQSIHYIDQLINVMGPVKSVIAKTKTLHHNIEGEDIGTAILEFENGALGTIEGSTAIFAGFPERLEIHGNEGSIVLESGAITQCILKNPIDRDDSKSSGTTSGSSDPTAVDLSLHIAQYAHITECILNEKTPEVDGHEALKSIRVLEAIYQSAKSGRQVDL